jgi:flagellar hook assembly protein FlgD
VTQTPIPQPFQITLSLYNSAGEQVKQLFAGSSQNSPTGISYEYLPASSQGIPIAIQINGINSAGSPPAIIWEGANNGGQPVDNGVYYLKMETIDPFGNVTAYTKEVTVMGNTGGNSLAVYNSAGELVKTIPLLSYPNDLMDFNFSGQPGASSGTMAGGFDPATGQPRGQLKLDLTDSQGASHAYVWDGSNDQGGPVSSGVYTLKLVKNELGHLRIVKTKSVTVINAQGSPAQASAASAVAGPNPLMGEAARSPQAAFVVSYMPSQQGSGHVRFYNLAGELIAQGTDFSKSGKFTIQAGDLSSGIYLVNFEIRSGNAILARKILKVVVMK